GEQGDSLPPFLWRQQREELLRDVRRKLAQKQRAIIGGDVTQQLGDVFLAHGFDQSPLSVGRHVFEDRRREPPRQDAKRNHLIVGSQVGECRSDLRRTQTRQF